MAVLIVLGGCPGTGKSTLARVIAAERRAAWLRIDVIEHALRGPDAMAGPIGPAGYLVAYAIAAGNLRNGLDVVADCANPLAITRAAWRQAAAGSAAALVEIELVCSDPVAHRRRVEQRAPEWAGQVLPGWDDVAAMVYEPWTGPRLIVDTAFGVDRALDAIRTRLQPAGTKPAV